MSRMRVWTLAVVVGVAMVMPMPMTAWAGQQVQKVAKQEKNGEKKATQHKGDKKKEKEPGKKGKKSTGNEPKPEKAGKREEKKEQKEKKAEKTGEEKVTVCHRPPGKPENAQTITIGASAVEKHLAHGDSEGPCK